MNKETLDYLSDKIGVKLSVRDKEEWMNESMDVRAKHLAKMTQLKRVKRSDISNESIDDFYRNARRKD